VQEMQTKIRAAIENGDLGAVKRLVKTTPGLLHQPVPTGVSHKERGQILRYRPVTLAAVKCQTAILSFLLDAGGDPAEYGNFPLCRAALYDTAVPAIEMLLRHGADVDGVGNDYGPPLVFACEGSALKAMACLLDHGAKITGEGPGLTETVPWNALKHAAYFNRGCPGMLALLLDHGGDPNSEAVDPVKGVPRGSALHNAAEKEDVEGVKLLLEHGAVPNAQNDRGQRPADMTQNREIKKLLEAA
jgi:ankyrin repeat protein